MTHKNAIRNLLLDMRPHTNSELARISLRYGAYIYDLRHEDNLLIETKSVPGKPGLYTYTYKGLNLVGEEPCA